MKLAMMILLAFLFSGCAEKIVWKDKLVCFEQSKFDKPTVTLRIKKEDLEVAQKFSKAIDDAFELYELQVDVNNDMCENIKKGVE